MAILYLDEYGATLRASGERLIVEKDDQQIATARPQELELVIVLVTCGFTSAAARLLLTHGIDVAFLDEHGDYLGRLEGAFGKNVSLRRQQYALADDPAFRLGMARAIARGKLTNMRTVVMRYARQGMPALDACVARMLDALAHVEACGDLDTLRGVEGAGSAAYFDALSHIVQPPFVFTDRNRRPPRDPVNAMLGFSYALLLSYVERAVSAVGLDAYCGFYHCDHYGRMSLALDLLEEFRPVLADSVVLAACSRHWVDPARDFEARDGGIFLNETGRQAFVQRFHARMEEDVTDLDGDATVPYHQVCVNQARALAACVRDGVPAYRPFLVK